jgi:hypothetical protein
MLTYLDAVAAEERELSPYEAQLLDWMITRSDNASAEVLWALLGSGRVAAYLKSHGLEPLPTIEDAGVGETTVESPRDLALLFARLHAGELLSPQATKYALGLLGRIDPSQIWGVTAGLVDLESPPRVFMKDGWFPADGGWRINSAGLILPVDGHAPYILVVLADGQPSYQYGVETVATISEMVNGMMMSGAIEGLNAYR